MHKPQAKSHSKHKPQAKGKARASQCKPTQTVNDEDKDENDMHKNIHTITSISTNQDQHVSDRQECDEGVKLKTRCLNMLTRMYQQGRREHYSKNV